MLFSKKFIAAGLEYSDYDYEVPAPYLRKNISFDKLPEKITITVTALGFYKLYVNGKEITRTHLAPYVSNPNNFLAYDSYDIREYLKEGRNTLAFLLGNGFQNNYGGFIWLFQNAPFRSSPRLAFAIEYEDGETKSVIEADSTVLTHPSPLVANDFRVGVRYDARKEIEGWSLPTFDDSAWTPAISVLPYGGETFLSTVKPITVTAVRKPVAIWQEDDAYVYDFGINDTGLTTLRIKGEAGQKVTIHHGEYIADGKFDQDNILFTHTNKKAIGMPAYTQRTEYILRGEGVEEYTPDFTYYGFRYAKVEGITKEQATEDLLTYLVMSTDLKERGGFTSSDETLNTLEEMSIRSTVSNFLHYPLDCPHREKNGWTGDAAVSAEQTMLRFDPEANYKTWLQSIVCDQDSKGAIPCINPTSGWGYEWGSGPAWDRVIVELPYQEYVLRGELTLARITAASHLKYFEYLRARVNERGLIAFGLGDWLAPNDALMPSLEFTDTLVSYDMLRKSSLLFRAMGRRAEADFILAFAKELREAIREKLLDRSTMTFDNGGESAQSLAIYYGLCDNEEERRLAFEVLVREIEARGGYMTVGILGQKGLFRVLAEGGRIDLALNMITRPDAPSYGFMVKDGYTSISECITGKVQSFNHHIWCDFSAFLITHIAGIRMNPTETNVMELLVAPTFPSSLDRVRAYYRAPVGRIDVFWEKKDGVIRFTLGMPTEMKATVKLPDGYCFEDGTTERAGKPGTFTVIKK